MADSLVQVLLPRRAELAPYDRHILDMHAARDAATYYNAARAAAEIAPQSTVAANDLPSAALKLNLPAQALDYLERIDMERGEASRLPAYWARLSAALHLLGRYERQLEVGKQVRRRFPDDDRSYFYQARALAALGRLGELDVVLTESLHLPTNSAWGAPGVSLHTLVSDELRVHGHPDHARIVLERAVAFYQKAPVSLQRIPMHRFDMGRLLGRLGRPEEGRRLLEDVLAEGGAIGADDLILRGEIGVIAALQGNLRTVELHDRWLSQLDRPYLKGLNTEYRARMAAMLGRKDDAFRLLQQATTEGYGFGLERHQAYEYQGLRGYPPFDEFMRPKG